MADSVATLFVEVDSKDVKSAINYLSRLEQQSRKSENTNKKLSRSNTALSSSFSSLSGVIKGYIGLIGAKEIIRAADTFTTLENRLKNVTNTAAELAEAQKAVFDISQETRTTLESTATLYQRLAISTADAGISSQKLADITRGLQQAFVVSGATAQESRNAVIQLAQGLASGQLRGEEFRSVSEQGIRVIKALTESLGLNVGQLRELAYAGELTTDVFIEAFSKQLPKINDEFRQFESTIGQAATRLQNSFVGVVGATNDLTGASSALTGVMISASENIDIFTRSIIDTDGAIRLASEGSSLLADQLGEKLKTAISRSAPELAAIAAIMRGLGIEADGLTLDEFRDSLIKATPILGGSIKVFEGLITKGKELRNELDPRNFDYGTGIIQPFGDSPKETITKPSKEVTNALQSIRDKIASLNAVESGNIGEKIAAKYSNLARVLGKTNPELQKLIDLETKLAQAAEDEKTQKERENSLKKYLKEIESATDEIDKIRLSSDKYERKLLDKRVKELREIGISEVDIAEYVASEMERIDEDRLNSATDAYSGMERAIREYQEEAEDAAASVERAFSKSFKAAEDSITEFVKTGKLEVSSFVDSILDELIRAQISRPIVSGISSSFGGDFFSSLFGLFSANGNVFNKQGVTAFANGGVVSSATPFTYGGGQMGVMGEAGPEAILPLERKGGKLGVSATAANVNVYVQNAPENTKVERSPNAAGGEDITVIIGEIVDKNLSSGRHDNTLQRTFNVNRRGY